MANVLVVSCSWIIFVKLIGCSISSGKLTRSCKLPSGVELNADLLADLGPLQVHFCNNSLFSETAPYYPHIYSDGIGELSVAIYTIRDLIRNFIFSFILKDI